MRSDISSKIQGKQAHEVALISQSLEEYLEKEHFFNLYLYRLRRPCLVVLFFCVDAPHVYITGVKSETNFDMAPSIGIKRGSI